MESVLLCVDKDGTEIISGMSKMERVDDQWLPEPYDYDDYGDPKRSDDYVTVPKGTIKLLIGRELTWEDEPVEWFGNEVETTTEKKHKEFKPFDKVIVRIGSLEYPDLYSKFIPEIGTHHTISGWANVHDDNIFPYSEKIEEKIEQKTDEIVIKEEDYIDTAKWKLVAGRFTTGDVITILDGSSYKIIACNSWNYILEDLNGQHRRFKVDYVDDPILEDGEFAIKEGDMVMASDEPITNDPLDWRSWRAVRFNHITTLFEPKGGHLKTSNGTYRYVIPIKEYKVPSFDDSRELAEKKLEYTKKNIYTVDPVRLTLIKENR